MDESKLKNKFERQLEYNVTEMKKYGRFTKLQQVLISMGYFEGARMLINKDNTSGLSDLLLHDRKDLSIEHLALQEEFQSLFTKQEIDKCKYKLGIR